MFYWNSIKKGLTEEAALESGRGTPASAGDRDSVTPEVTFSHVWIAGEEGLGG